jgi:phage tail-like protein
MPREHDDDFQGSFFALEIDKVPLAFFTACSGLNIEFNVVNFKQGDGKQVVVRKRPGNTKYSEVVLKRGFSPDKALHDWFKKFVDAKEKSDYKTASIAVYDRQQEVVARFNLDRAWPSKLSVSDLNAGTDEVMVEELTLHHEKFDWA